VDARDVSEEVFAYKFFLWTPDGFPVTMDDGVEVWVTLSSPNTRRRSEEMREEVEVDLEGFIGGGRRLYGGGGDGGRIVSRASPAPPHLKRGSYEKPPSPPSPALKPSYSQIVKTKKLPRDPEKQARDPKRTSCDISRDPLVPPRSHDQTRDQTRSRVQPRSHDRPRFGHATHLLIGTWQTVGINQLSTRSKRSRGIPQGIPHSFSPMDTGTGNTLIGLRA